jgi:hypothetical protein
MNKNAKINQKYSELVKAIFNSVGKEYERLYWNRHQREVFSPFYSGGDEYTNDVFSVHSYNYDWDEPTDDINFNYKNGDFCATWYKHSSRGLYFWSGTGKRINAEFLNTMLKDCLQSMAEDPSLWTS